MEEPGSGAAPTLFSVVNTCDTTTGVSQLSFVCNKVISDSVAGVVLTHDETQVNVWSGIIPKNKNAATFTVTATPNGAYTLTADNGENSISIPIVIKCLSSCDLVFVAAEKTDPATSGGLGSVLLRYATATPFVVGITVSGPVTRAANYNNTGQALVENLPAGQYHYTIALAQDSCLVEGDFTLNDPVIVVPPPPPPPACTLQLTLAHYEVARNLTSPGKVAYVIGGAVDASVNVNLVRLLTGQQTTLVDTAVAGNGNFELSSQELTAGDYRLLISQNAGTTYACASSQDFSLIAIPVIVEPPITYDPGPAPVPYYGEPIDAVLGPGDSFLLLLLQQNLQTGHALAQDLSSTLTRATAPAGISFTPLVGSTAAFAALGVVSGETESRLGEVSGFNTNTPYVVGEYGVTHVDEQVVEYVLDEITYRTERSSGLTQYRIGYVDPIEAGLLPLKALYGRDELMYHEQRPLVNGIAIDRQDQPVLLDFYAVARATSLDQLPTPD
jgi:hypothetical protein